MNYRYESTDTKNNGSRKCSKRKLKRFYDENFVSLGCEMKGGTCTWKMFTEKFILIIGWKTIWTSYDRNVPCNIIFVYIPSYHSYTDAFHYLSSTLYF